MELHESQGVDLNFLVSQIADGIYFADENGIFRYANESLASILGYSHVDMVLGKSFLNFVDPEMVEKLQEQFFMGMSTGNEKDCYEVRILRPDGVFRWVEVRPTRIRKDGHLHGSFGVLRDVTKRKSREEDLKTLSSTDELTGLLNRRGFKIAFSRKFSHEEGFFLRTALLFIDIDRFKMINDLHGHIEGDKALLVIAETLRRTFGEQCIIGRWGGDEFVVAIVDLDGHLATKLAQQFHQKLNEQRKEYGLAYQLSVTIGFTDSAESKTYDFNKMLSDADRDLCKRKRSR